MHTLNQWLGSFSTESRAAILSWYRQECLLLPPINRGGFQGLRRTKIGSKVSKKSASSRFLPPSLFVSLSLSLSLSIIPTANRGHQHPHHQLDRHPLHHISPSSPIASPFSSTTAAAHQRHHFCFLPSLAPATTTTTTSALTSTVTISLTTTVNISLTTTVNISLTTIISINPAPHHQ